MIRKEVNRMYHLTQRQTAIVFECESSSPRAVKGGEITTTVFCLNSSANSGMNGSCSSNFRPKGFCPRTVRRSIYLIGYKCLNMCSL